MAAWQELWRVGWTEGTATTRFRLATILSLLAVLAIALVSLVESVWLWVAHVVIWAVTQ